MLDMGKSRWGLVSFPFCDRPGREHQPSRLLIDRPRARFLRGPFVARRRPKVRHPLLGSKWEPPESFKKGVLKKEGHSVPRLHAASTASRQCDTPPDSDGELEASVRWPKGLFLDA